MKLEPFERIREDGDQRIVELQDRLESFFRQFDENPLMNAIHLRTDNKSIPLKGIGLTTSAISIEHKLGKVPNGWIVTRRDANAIVYESTYSSEELKSRYLRLVASATVTVDLLVF